MIGKRIRIMFALAVLILNMAFMTTSFADDGEVVLGINDSTIDTGTSTTLTVTLRNLDGGDIKTIDGLDNFEVLGTSHINSTQTINGITTKEVGLNINIMPKNIGTFTLKAHVDVDGREVLSNELTVTVTEQDASLQEETQDVFIKATLTKDKLYFGEKTLLTYELYSRYNVSNIDYSDQPVFNNFLTKDLENSNQNGSYLTINGNKYVKYVIKETVLTPTDTGHLTIPSFNVNVYLGSNSFFGSTETKVVKTEEKRIEVSELPLKGQPDDFSRIVGDIQVEGQYSAAEIEANDSLTLTVSIKGDANLDGFTELPINDSADFSIYQNQLKADESKIGDDYQASKEFQVIFIPKKSGELTIEPIHVVYFDPVEKSYKTAVIDGKTIHVKGDKTAGTIADDQSFSGEDTSGNDAAPLQTVTLSTLPIAHGSNDYLMIPKNALYIGFMSVIGVVVCIILFFVFYKKRGKNKGGYDDPVLKEAYASGKKAQSLMEVKMAVELMIKHTYGFSIFAYCYEDIGAKLKNQELTKRIIQVIDDDREISIEELKTYLEEIYKIVCKIDKQK